MLNKIRTPCQLVVVVMLTAINYLAIAEAEQILASDSNCRQIPKFVHELGLNPQRSAFSSSVPRQPGLFYLEFTTAGGAQSQSYQHPSWKTAGYLGAFALSQHGDIFIIPSPHVNLFDNPPDKSNNVYRVASHAPEMNQFVNLPSPQANLKSSAFGTLGLSYSCTSDSIYVSSVFGSTRLKEVGNIFQIDSQSAVIKSTLRDFDAFGLATILIDSKPFLLAGSARNSILYAFTLDTNGKITGQRKELLSLSGLGPRGDDRIKKIVFDPARRLLIITGYAFHFNFVNPIIPQQTEYYFKWNDNWQIGLVGIQ